MNSTAARPGEPRLKELFNIGVKAPDVEAEQAFFDAFRPTRRFVVDRPKATSGPKQIPAVELGGTNLFLVSEMPYEADLPQPHPGGLCHVSFLVESVDDVVANLERQGIKPFRGPYVAEIGGVGRRKLVFYRSPSGTIIEPQEVLK